MSHLEPFQHRPIPPTPPRRAKLDSFASPSVQLEEDGTRGFSELSDEGSAPLTLPVEKSNSPTSINYVSNNKNPRPILKKQEPPQQVVQLTGYCTHCNVPILYTPMPDGETLVKCYNCPTVNTFTGEERPSTAGEEEVSPVTSPRGENPSHGDWNSKVKGAFKTMRSANFMKVAAEKTASAAATAKVAAQKASATTKVAAQKASATTKVVAQKAAQTTKEAAKEASHKASEAAQKAKHTLQRGNSQVDDDGPGGFKSPGLKNSGEVLFPEATRIFGIPLEEAVRKSCTMVEDVPDIVVHCVDFIRQRGLKEEGIFRISGSQQTVKDYKLAFDKGETPDLSAISDEHVVAGLLKLYFRELPNPLFTMALGPEFKSLERLPEAEMVPRLGPLVHKLPKINLTVLRLLLELLVEVNMHESENKMTVQNLGIVFAPTLGCPMEVIGPMIKNYDQVFNFDLIQF